jgi:hypothetical protein
MGKLIVLSYAPDSPLSGEAIAKAAAEMQKALDDAASTGKTVVLSIPAPASIQVFEA